MKVLSCLQVAGISASDIAKWRAQGFGKSSTARAVDKSGDDATIEANVLSRWINITPAMATNWLKNNFGNRPIADDVVKAYARDIVNGVWQPTHQGIAFNDEDQLIDGQHRLRAIILANKTVRMMVTFGLPAKIEGSQMTTMDCVDRGRTRSVADQLKIQHGLKNGTAIAQVTSALSGLCYERVRRLSVGQTLDIYQSFQASIEHVIEHRSKKRGLKSAGVLAGFAFAMVKEDGSNQKPLPVLPQQAFTALNSGNGLEQFPNIKLLRDFLTGSNAALILSSMNRGIAELTVQALYLEGCKQRVEKLELSMDGVNHFRAAQPDRVAKVSAMFKLPALEKVNQVDAPKVVTTPTTDQPSSETTRRCECGKSYTGKRHRLGCLDCRKSDEGGGKHRDIKIKNRRINSDEYLAGDAV